MPIAHTYGSDLTLGPTGDLACAAGITVGQQRVLRRLLTNPGAYVWHTRYGAGLGAFVGQPNASARIRGVAQLQMRRERAVSRHPVPVAVVTANPNGTTILTVSYGDVTTGQAVTLAAPV